MMRIQEYQAVENHLFILGLVITEILTRVQHKPNGLANSDLELYGGNCVQDARGPFILHRARTA